MSIRDGLEANLKEREHEFQIARQEFDAAQKRYHEIDRDIQALHAAIAVLDGEPVTYVTMKPQELISDMVASQKKVEEAVLGSPAPKVTAKPNTVTIDGEEVILEPGFKVVKNSFGEDCIVPENHPGFAPMQEPIRPTVPLGAAPVIVPGISNDFEDPRKMY